MKSSNRIKRGLAKKILKYTSYVLIMALLISSFSCQKDNSDDLGNVEIKPPENVILSNYSDYSITVAWDSISGATSYTVQLMDSEDSNKPIEDYILISEYHYQFDNVDKDSSYYVRVRANFNSVTSDWVYIMNNQEIARIIPEYGVVDKDFDPDNPDHDPGQVDSLVLYENFPEGWEIHDGTRKKSFGAKNEYDTFPSGKWHLKNAYSLDAGSMKNKIGTWAMLVRGEGKAPWVEMDFDLPNGASKFSFYYGAATWAAKDADPLPMSIYVQYSQDQGDEWTQLGADLVVDSVKKQYFMEYDLDITGPVRFRIGKDNSDARLFIDDIAVYKN